MKRLFSRVLFIAMIVFSVSAFAIEATAQSPVPNTGFERLWKTDWSLDGNYIAFGVGLDIYIIAVDGGVPVNLTADIEDRCTIPVFSKDSSEVYFTRMHLDENRHITRFSTDAVDIETGEKREVFEDAFAAAFSPDRKYVVYLKQMFWSVITNLETGEEVQYDMLNNPDAQYSFGHFAIGPDPSHFVTTFFVFNEESSQNNNGQLFRVMIDTGDIQRIEIDDYSYWYPKYSPDGTKLLATQFDYSNTDSRNMPAHDVIVFDILTEEVTVIGKDSGLGTMCGSWSPDGSRICYILDEEDYSSLYIHDIVQGAHKIVHSEGPGSPSAVEDTTPSMLSITGNFPNPFNLETTIEFSLQDAGDVHISIYNVMGQQVRELVSGHMSQGSHSVVWNGCDNSGKSVSSGVYTTRLLMRDKVTTGQMMLLK